MIMSFIGKNEGYSMVMERFSNKKSYYALYFREGLVDCYPVESTGAEAWLERMIDKYELQ